MGKGIIENSHLVRKLDRVLFHELGHFVTDVIYTKLGQEYQVDSIRAEQVGDDFKGKIILVNDGKNSGKWVELNKLPMKINRCIHGCIFQSYLPDHTWVNCFSEFSHGCDDLCAVNSLLKYYYGACNNGKRLDNFIMMVGESISHYKREAILDGFLALKIRNYTCEIEESGKAIYIINGNNIHNLENHCKDLIKEYEPQVLSLEKKIYSYLQSLSK